MCEVKRDLIEQRTEKKVLTYFRRFIFFGLCVSFFFCVLAGNRKLPCAGYLRGMGKSGKKKKGVWEIGKNARKEQGGGVAGEQ